MFQRFIAILAAPGAKDDIQDAAPTQPTVVLNHGSSSETQSLEHKEAAVTASEPVKEEATSPAPTSTTGKLGALTTTSMMRSNPLDRALDRLVAFSGSQTVFLLIMLGLLLWALLGIPYGQVQDWQVGISDAQALISYFFDSLLMRQLLNGYTRQIRVTAALRSRGISVRRMLRDVQLKVWKGEVRCIEQSATNVTHGVVGEKEPVEEAGFAAELPSENWLGRLSTATSKVLGHLVTVCGYWVCIFIWLGFGPYCDWSNEWQLYINSATSALMVLIFAFLANIRERHDAHIANCFQQIFTVDAAVEKRLRSLTGDVTPNPVIVVPAPKVGRLQRAIFYYADVVGTLVGVALLIIVVVVWLAIGPALQFNSNWWLVIGTYAGLVGLNDGFVLRNVQAKFIEYENDAFQSLVLDDAEILLPTSDNKTKNLGKTPDVEALAVQAPEQATFKRQSLTYWLSIKMGVICAHEYTVLIGVLSIVGLLVGASAMGWSETGQLLCNIPPSIIESFFMMILLTGHNLADAQRREDLHRIYEKRLRVLEAVERVEMVC
jgi:low-affinity ferrous iron transport protein